MYTLDTKMLAHSPRAVKFWECCLGVFYENLSSFNQQPVDKEQSDPIVNINNLSETAENSFFFLDKAFECYVKANQNHRSSYEFGNPQEYKEQIYSRRIRPKKGGNRPNTVFRQEFIVNKAEVKLNPRIAVANTKVLEKNIKRSLRQNPNFEGSRFDTLYKIFKQTKEEAADILLFPECFMPVEFLDRMVWFSANEQKLVVTGLEHITVGGISFNFIVTILPFVKNGIKDAVVVYRLKNHYSHAEKLMIEANHYRVPRPTQYIYDLFIWKGIYFSPYYCFELADVKHRSLFKSKIDLLIACEWNPDVNYFSTIVDSISRDIHVFVAQVNTSQFGDTRITQPAKTERKDILKLKGGENDTILVGDIDIESLREFQRELYAATKDDKIFKPLPPDFDIGNVLKRIRNRSIL